MANIKRGNEEIDWICDAAQHPSSNNFHRYCDWWDYKQDMEAMEREARKITSIKTKLAWSGNKHFKRMASMPLHIFNLMWHMDKDFARNTPEGKKSLLRFIMRRKEFSVPTS